MVAGLGEVFLELVEAAQFGVDGLGQVAGRLAAALAGPMIVQNSEWLAWPPPLLRTAVRMFSGTLSMLRHKSSMVCLSTLGPCERLVQIGDVGLVMLVVMDFHRLGVDVRLQGVGRIRQIGKCVWPWLCLLVSGFVHGCVDGQHTAARPHDNRPSGSRSARWPSDNLRRRVERKCRGDASNSPAHRDRSAGSQAPMKHAAW